MTDPRIATLLEALTSWDREREDAARMTETSDAHEALVSLADELAELRADRDGKTVEEEGAWIVAAEQRERVVAAEAELAVLREALEEIASTDFDEPSDFSELGRIARAVLARAAQPDGGQDG